MPRSMLEQLKCVGECGVKICRPFWSSAPREVSRCDVPDPLGWSAWRDTWQRGRPKGAGSVAIAPMLWPECDVVVPSGEVHSRSVSRCTLIGP